MKKDNSKNITSSPCNSSEELSSDQNISLPKEHLYISQMGISGYGGEEERNRDHGEVLFCLQPTRSQQHIGKRKVKLHCVPPGSPEQSVQILDILP